MGTLMASSCVLNRPSKPKTTTRFEKINNGYLQSLIASTNSGNTCSDFESENLKTQNNVDLSWLPNYDNDNSASESHHHNREIDFDYSWLPDHIHSKSSNSRETENNSWLPSASTLIVNDGDDDDSWLPNYNDVKKNTSTILSKPNNLCRSRKTSSFSYTHTVTNGNQSNETINNNNNNKYKKSKNQDHEAVSSREEEIQHAKPVNKKPESSTSHGQVSPSKSNCSVETDSLGGVSTLCRRFQDLAESRNTNRKPKCSSGGNHNSERGAPPSTTAGNKNELFSPICSTWDHQKVAGENKCFSHITGKPRLIRGRQAFNDFLNRMEQDKQRELECLAQRKPVSLFSHRGRIRALLRFRFIRPGAEPKTHKLKSITKDHHQITKLTTQVKEVMDKSHEIDTSSHSTQRLDDPIQLENYHDCVNDYSQSQSDWDDDEEEEEEEDDDDESSWDMEPFHDWITEIARPKRYWECMRRARYHEMRYLYSYKQDLQELLERRCVAGFLSSDHRDKIDELMGSWVQGIELRKEDMEEEEDEGGWSKLERKCWEYNEFIDQTRVQEERSYQSSSSIEMELVYDLRGQLEQLDGVMMEKGKSIPSCVDMQFRLFFLSS